MSITVSPAFSIGQKVYIKSILDQLLPTTSTDGMQTFVSFDLTKLLYKIDAIKVSVTSSGTTLYYNLSTVATPSAIYTGVSDGGGEAANIAENNIYSLAVAAPLITAKLGNFDTYQKSIS